MKVLRRRRPLSPSDALGPGRPTRYVPVHVLGSVPHLMIDGVARPGTAITLSHWPRSSTPPELRRDLSAQIVLAALEAGYLDESGVDVATIDHYDEDGVVALALAVLPGLAERHSDLLVEAAAVGDVDARLGSLDGMERV